MNKRVASALIDIAVRELRGRSYAALSAMIGDPQLRECAVQTENSTKLKSRSLGCPPKTTWERSGNLSIDDGTFASAFHPMTRSFIMAPDAAYVGG